MDGRKNVACVHAYIHARSTKAAFSVLVAKAVGDIQHADSRESSQSAQKSKTPEGNRCLIRVGELNSMGDASSQKPASESSIRV